MACLPQLPQLFSCFGEHGVLRNLKMINMMIGITSLVLGRNSYVFVRAQITSEWAYHSDTFAAKSSESTSHHELAFLIVVGAVLVLSVFLYPLIEWMKVNKKVNLANAMSATIHALWFFCVVGSSVGWFLSVGAVHSRVLHFAGENGEFIINDQYGQRICAGVFGLFYGIIHLSIAIVVCKSSHRDYFQESESLHINPTFRCANYV